MLIAALCLLVRTCQIVQGTGSVSILVPVIVIKVGQEVIALNTRVNGSIIVQVKSVFTSLNGKIICLKLLPRRLMTRFKIEEHLKLKNLYEGCEGQLKASKDIKKMTLRLSMVFRLNELLVVKTHRVPAKLN